MRRNKLGKSRCQRKNIHKSIWHDTFVIHAPVGFDITKLCILCIWIKILAKISHRYLTLDLLGMILYDIYLYNMVLTIFGFTCYDQMFKISQLCTSWAWDTWFKFFTSGIVILLYMLGIFVAVLDSRYFPIRLSLAVTIIVFVFWKVWLDWLHGRHIYIVFHNQSFGKRSLTNHIKWYITQKCYLLRDKDSYLINIFYETLLYTCNNI